MRFLLDANLSPATGRFLTTALTLDVADLYERGLGRLTDEEIVDLAQRERRVIITFDLDFGELYYRRERGRFGVIILRLENQQREMVNQVLLRFLRDHADSIPLETSLVILDGVRVRVSTEP